MVKELERNLGVNFKNGQPASVRFWAPEAKEAAIKIADETFPLEKQDFGYWVTSLD
jgi:hypothetical protein